MRISIIFVLIVSALFTADAQVVDANEVFEKLNLSLPGLEKVKSYVADEQFDKAHEELLFYFQQKQNRVADFNEYAYEDDAAVAAQLENSFSFKNHSVDFGETIDWARVHADKEWQFSLNRMNWFGGFVAAYSATRDPAIIAAWSSQIESWIALGNPGFPRTIDTGRRLENLVMSHWKFVVEMQAEGIEPVFHSRLLLSMFQQAEYLYQPENWRKFSNWGTFESSGFLLLTILYPEFKANENWLKEAFFRLRTQFAYSFYDDGMHIETSPSYHSHELMVWFDFLRLALRNNIDDPWSPQNYLEPIDDILLNTAKALMFLTKPTGEYPQLGDTDKDDESNLLLQIGEWYQDENLQYVGSKGVSGTPPAALSAHYPDGGYTIMRSSWGTDAQSFKEAHYLVFDAGLNKPWHAHYDMLSVVISAFGQPVFIDPGRFTYNDGPEREAFKSTAYHSTVVVDDKSQSRYATIDAKGFTPLKQSDFVWASHSAYEGVEHKRTVFFGNREYWLITDLLNSDDQHQYKQLWHLDASARGNVSMDEDGRRITVPNAVVWYGEQGDADLTSGYVSYKYREKEAAPVISIAAPKAKRALLTTVVFPFKESAPLPEVKQFPSSDESGIHLEIMDGSGSDLFYQAAGPEVTAETGRIQTDAELVFLRFDDSGDVEYLAMLHGTKLNVDGILLFEADGKCDLEVTSSQAYVTGDTVCSVKVYSQTDKVLFINEIQVEQIIRHEDYITF